MEWKLALATADDVAGLVALRNAVNQDLTARFGKGPWTGNATAKGVLFNMRRASVYAAWNRGELIGTMTLGTRKPWAIDASYFHASARPLYLTGMEVRPELQRQGVGREFLKQAIVIAKAWPAGAIRLDAWDAEAGAGEFYRKCGFEEVGRATYRTAPLIYFERLL